MLLNETVFTYHFYDPILYVRDVLGENHSNYVYKSPFVLCYKINDKRKEVHLANIATSRQPNSQRRDNDTFDEIIQQRSNPRRIN